MPNLFKNFIFISAVLLFLTGFVYADTLIPPYSQSYVTQPEFRDFKNQINNRDASYYISIKEYIDTRFDASKEAIKINQSSMDSRFVRIEKYLTRDGDINDKISETNDKILSSATMFSEKISKTNDKISSSANICNEKMSVLGDRLTRIETQNSQNSQNSKSWVIGLGIFFTIIQIIIQFINRRTNNNGYTRKN